MTLTANGYLVPGTVQRGTYMTYFVQVSRVTDIANNESALTNSSCENAIREIQADTSRQGISPVTC